MANLKYKLPVENCSLLKYTSGVSLQVVAKASFALHFELTVYNFVPMYGDLNCDLF